MWFLTSMFVSYMLFSFFRQRKCVLLSCCLCIIVTYLFRCCPYLLPWSIDTSFLFAVFMIFGEEMRKLNLLNKIKPFFFIGLVILYFFFMPYWGDINFSVRIYGDFFLLTTFLAALGSFIMMKVSILINRIKLSCILSSIGRHSLTIFCLQFPVFGMWGKLLSYTGVDVLPIIKAILVVLLTLITLYPTSIFVERYIINKIQNHFII